MINNLSESKVPVKGLLIGYLVSLCLVWSGLIWAYTSQSLMFASPHDQHPIPLLILCFVSVMVLLFLFSIIGIWFFIYHDAGRRGMNQWLWTFIAIFMPNLIGIIIYLILRKPLLNPCPGCGSMLEPQLLYCPRCGRQSRQKCPSCNAPLDLGSQFCGACGAKLAN